MLSGIHPILNGVVLAALDRLGHGDEIAVVDANFPAYRVGSTVVDLPEVASALVLQAVRTVVPLDAYEGASVILMTAEDGERLEVQHELVEAAEVASDRVDELERRDFYSRAAGSQLIVRTGELRPYGNVIVRKGVINRYESPGAAR